MTTILNNNHNSEDDDDNNSHHNSSSTNNMKPETIGEELYLVHLRRHEGNEPKAEDFDQYYSPSSSSAPTSPTTIKRHRGFSAGEELWQIHLKRSRGLEYDPDDEEHQQQLPPSLPMSPKEESKSCPYNLRRRMLKEG